MKTIKIGHGETDISCGHGSRWIWWFDQCKTSEKPMYRGEWMNVVWASNCRCGTPPLPFKTVGQVQAYLYKKAGIQKELSEEKSKGARKR